MGIYIFSIFLVCTTWTVLKKDKFEVRDEEIFSGRNKSYVIFIGIFLFFEAALRNYTVGADTGTYLVRYVRFANTDWKDIFQLADSMMFEHGFAVFNKLLTYINDNPRFLLVITAFIIVFSYSYKIYKNSTMPWLSYFIFITLGFYGLSLSAIRQYIAVAIILFSYDAIIKNELIEFIVLVLLATTIHTSSIIVLPMFWLSKIKYSKINMSVFLIMFLSSVSLFFRYAKQITNFILPYIRNYRRYFNSFEGNIGNGAVGETLIYLAFLVLILIELNNSEDEARNMYIAFAITSVIFALFSFVLGISARILPYFSSMFIISIPKAITSEVKPRIRIQYLTVICVVLLIYYFAIICRANTSRLIPYELWNNEFNVF